MARIVIRFLSTILLALLVSCGGAARSDTGTPALEASAPASQRSPARAASQSEPDTAAPDLCSLLTPDEVAQALAVPAATLKLVTQPRPYCEYTVHPAAGSAPGSVNLWVFQDASAKGAFEIGKTAQDSSPKQVEGVGDDAYWSESIDTLNVLKGDSYLMVQLLAESADLATAKALALKAVERVP